MIKYLSIENFYSIKNENIVEFDLNVSDSGVLAHPTLGFAGTNASGKTNFIKAINFLVWFIGQSFFTKESKLPYEKFVGSEELPTKFNFIFCIKNDEFGYELEINLISGRKHQIRTQLEAIGCPILGDKKYGSDENFAEGIALHCRCLELNHPTLKIELRFEAEVPAYWQWSGQ